eukprot:801880-Rhodomonas_salina.1
MDTPGHDACTGRAPRHTNGIHAMNVSAVPATADAYQGAMALIGRSLLVLGFLPGDPPTRVLGYPGGINTRACVCDGRLLPRILGDPLGYPVNQLN